MPGSKKAAVTSGGRAEMGLHVDVWRDCWGGILWLCAGEGPERTNCLGVPSSSQKKVCYSRAVIYHRGGAQCKTQSKALLVTARLLRVRRDHVQNGSANGVIGYAIPIGPVPGGAAAVG